ncbi:MAG: hypothetical protein VCA39_19685, partial [Pseudomonas sp.]|uniref:hypothetical protein n=1 Tax=Pseudomonas sp. TaxID=306 RepID=UPI003982311F
RRIAAADVVLIHGAFPVPTQKGAVPITDFSLWSERHHCLFQPFPPLETVVLTDAKQGMCQCWLVDFRQNKPRRSRVCFGAVEV